MPGDARPGGPGRGAAAPLGLALLLLQDPVALSVGRVTAVAWPPQAALAAALAEQADRSPPFPGIGPLPDRPVQLFVAPSRAVFDSLTGRRLPPWTVGVADPDRRAIVLLADGAPDRVRVALRHELAHLALRWHVGRRLPLWFEEGYAAVAAGEWDRVAAVRLNWALLRGGGMALAEVDRALRRGADEAERAYALATTAVLLLERWDPERGLGPLLARLPDEPTLDAALRATHAVTLDDFESRWRRDVVRRYGWLTLTAGVGTVWGVAGLLVAWVVWRRRRRDRERRALLDAGWSVPSDDAPTA